jgi:recombination protein RecT
MSNTPAKTNEIKSLLTNDKVRAQIQAALPKHMTADRMARVALTALLKTPKLGQCKPESFMKAMMDCSSMGIEPDGRRAHLIPYGDQVQLIVDYKGLVELVRRSGEVKSIMAQVVYSGDEFEYTLGLSPDIHHKPAVGDRGEPIAVYAVAQLKDSAIQFEVMSAAEVNQIRDRSKAAKSGPWVTDWPEMAKKTVFRRLTKWLPLSYEVHDALSKDDEHTGIAGAKNVTPAPLQLFSGEPVAPPDIDAGEKTAAGGNPHGVIRRQIAAAKIKQEQLFSAITEIGIVEAEITAIDELELAACEAILANWDVIKNHIKSEAAE